jgi:hypothetical protein
MPGQVSEGNAHTKADALDDEIARDEEMDPPASTVAKTGSEKP